MVFAAKLVSNPWETEVKLTSHQIHGDLARQDDVFVAFGTQHLGDIDLEMFRGVLDDVLWGEVTRAHLFGIADQGGRRLDVWLESAQLSDGEELVERAFELADIGLDIVRKVFSCLGREGDAGLTSLGVDDRAAGLKVRHLDIDRHTPFETAT